MAIFKILLIFSAVTTFVLISRANILDSAWRKCFLLLSPLINSTNSSCTESEIDDKRSKIPSVESWSPLSVARYASSSLVISSKISALLVSAPACDCWKSKRFSLDPSELPTDMLMYLFWLLIDAVLVFCGRYFSGFF